MAVYELTVRFEAEDDQDALAFGAETEQYLAATPDGGRKLAVERVTKIIVTHMPVPGTLC